MSTREPDTDSNLASPLLAAGRASSNPPTWTPVLDDVALLEGCMAPVYPLGVNVLVARVGGALLLLTSSCGHRRPP